MNWKEFYDRLDSGTLPNVLLFAGEEALVKQEALSALEKKLLEPAFAQMNRMVLEGATAQAIEEAAQTLPMLADRRILTVRDWAVLLPGKCKDEESETERMLKFLSVPPDTCQLVFFMRSEPDFRKKLPAFLRKQGYEVRFEALSDAEIEKWIRRRLRPAGKSASRETVERLVYLAGRELTRLDGEVEKLIAYTGERAEISPQDVDGIVARSAEAGVFEMIDRLFSGDAAGAHQTLRTLLQTGQTRIALLALITRQLRMLTHLAFARESGASLDAVEKEMKIHPYAARKMRGQIRRLSARALEEAYLSCVEADFAVKSGKLRDAAALERILLKISDFGRN